MSLAVRLRSPLTVAPSPSRGHAKRSGGHADDMREGGGEGSRIAVCRQRDLESCRRVVGGETSTKIVIGPPDTIVKVASFCFGQEGPFGRVGEGPPPDTPGDLGLSPGDTTQNTCSRGTAGRPCGEDRASWLIGLR